MPTTNTLICTEVVLRVELPAIDVTPIVDIAIDMQNLIEKIPFKRADYSHRRQLPT